MYTTVVTAVTAGAVKVVGKAEGFVSSTLPLIVDYDVALMDRTHYLAVISSHGALLGWEGGSGQGREHCHTLA